MKKIFQNIILRLECSKNKKFFYRKEKRKIKKLKPNYYYAHVCKTDKNIWLKPQTLENHLQNTSKLAENFSSKFNSSEFGRIIGLLHDVGKGTICWQKYLKLKSGFGFNENENIENIPKTQPHAIHGAIIAENLFGKIGRIHSYCIAGHHTGLQDYSRDKEGNASLEFQLNKDIDIKSINPYFTEKINNSNNLKPPWIFQNESLDASLWIRMLYSCLVDADYLDTEAYMNSEKATIRGGYLKLSDIQNKLESYLRDLKNNSEQTEVNMIRNEIQKKCLLAADMPQGIFSLSVPTGGGKTLSSLAFGIKHSIKHNLDRVIYVAPYTSIIEQNATVFKNAIGCNQVVEHHSNIIEEDSTQKARVSAENWDAPVIITTNVQFFESLFASKSSLCRKLHNIVNSVVILDEAQLIPVKYLKPILETIKLLVEHYNVTFVISTATQPAFNSSKENEKYGFGLDNVHEIIGSEIEVKQLFQKLKRVEVSIPKDLNKKTNWEDISTDLKKLKQVLCIVSLKRSCRELFNLMPEGTYHLSTFMCGEHRSNIIEEIKKKLKNNEEVRVISTPLVEAGVNFDFPVVYRAFSGLDSIAQAAGRCNREGKLEKGLVKVFVSQNKPPIGILRKATETSKSLFASLNPIDPLENSIFKKYFEDLYWKCGEFDKQEIFGLLNPTRMNFGIYFRTASNKFKLIDDKNRKTVLIPYKKGEKLIKKIKKDGPDRFILRKMQRYSVSLYTNEFEYMEKHMALKEIYPDIFTIVQKSDYSKKIGIITRKET